MQSKRADGRGHWPPGKPRHRTDPVAAESAICALETLLATRHTPGEISIREAAYAVGVGDRAVRRWLARESIPSPRALRRLKRWIDHCSRGGR